MDSFHNPIRLAYSVLTNFETMEEALEYAENVKLAGYDDWWLPSAKDLQSIVDCTLNYPAITLVFKTIDSAGWF